MTQAAARPLVDLDTRSAGGTRAERGPWRTRRRRRRAPYLALGGLLVVVCVLGFAAATVRLGQRVAVLAVGPPVAAGQRPGAGGLAPASGPREPSPGFVPLGPAAAGGGRAAGGSPLAPAPL